VPSTIWKGSLSFGLVNVPVELHTATSDHTVRFHQLERGTADRVRNKRVNERTGREVEFSDIVKGYDLGGGEYVVLSAEELEAAAPERSRTIEITSFVDLAEIDPIFFRGTYYLAPQGEAARRAYALLRRGMHDAGRVGVASLVLRNKEYLVAVRPRADVLTLETMYFADEIRPAGGVVDDAPADTAFSDRELHTAQLLIESMTGSWEPDSYHDVYRDRVVEMIERKRNGEQITVEEVARPVAPVTDLMEALQASIERARSDAPTPQAAARRSRAAPAAGSRTKPAKQLASGRAVKSRKPDKPKGAGPKKAAPRTTTRRRAS
jgi:DNA end-binding protein Ku